MQVELTVKEAGWVSFYQRKKNKDHAILEQDWERFKT
jgi:hypothetical protein